MKNTVFILLSFLAAVLGAMGFGGGSVMLLIQTVFLNTNQYKAQGINLLFFIPVALVATLFNTVKKSIPFEKILPLSVGGMVGSAAGIFIALKLGKATLSHVVGIVVLLLGLREIISVLKTALERLNRG